MAKKHRGLLLLALGAGALYLFSKQQAGAAGAGQVYLPLPPGAMNPGGFPTTGTAWGGSPWNDPLYQNPEGFQTGTAP